MTGDGRGIHGEGKQGVYLNIEYLLFALKTAPYRWKRNGMGASSRAMHPNRVDAHRGFKFSYI